jgi:hypothetical protein
MTSKRIQVSESTGSIRATVIPHALPRVRASLARLLPKSP